MYVPPAFAVPSSTEALDALRRVAFGHLVTIDPGGSGAPTSTPLPFVVDDDLSELRAHIARGNPHWRQLGGLSALMIVTGPDAYVSPRWYPSKAEHGKVVPTWNYEVVHVHGTVEVIEDADWLRSMVSDLTDHHEARIDDPADSRVWEVTDAPTSFIDAQLRAIVGVRLEITSVVAKRKLSQNRPPADRAGVRAGLARSEGAGARATAEAMPPAEG
ncbi:MAG: FMN-binding negative transcriptional regulator [Acidimicrobiales bacterium]